MTHEQAAPSADSAPAVAPSNGNATEAEPVPAHSLMALIVGVLTAQHWALREAAARRAEVFWVAVVACLLAGIARRYDALPLEILLLAMLVAWIPPMLTGALFFATTVPLSRVSAMPLDRAPSYIGTLYFSYITPYMLTAPLALLYAIPVEQFADSLTAAKLNLVLLSVVSAWRVIVETEIMVAICGLTRLQAVARTAMVGGGVVAVVGFFSALQLALSGMGGVSVRIREAETLLQEASEFAMKGGAITFGIGVLLGLTSLVIRAGRRSDPPPPLPTITPVRQRGANSVLAAVAVAIAVGLCVAGQFIRIPDTDTAASFF